VGAVIVVVREVLRKDLLEMTPTEDEGPIEALPAHGADETLGDRVRSRSPNGRLDGPDALRAEDLIKAAADHRNSPLSITEIPQGMSGVRRGWSELTQLSRGHLLIDELRHGDGLVT
jgi:hypothetical protein